MFEIVKYPNPILKKKCREFTTEELKSGKVGDMTFADIKARLARAMAFDSGIGLAGPQIGLNLRVFMVNGTGNPDDDLIIFNPKLSNMKGEVVASEGCLSFPDVYIKVKRFAEVTLEGYDIMSKPFKLEAKDLLARVLQHEYDHLDGKLFIDYNMGAMDRVRTNKILNVLEARWERSHKAKTK